MVAHKAVVAVLVGSYLFGSSAGFVDVPARRRISSSLTVVKPDFLVWRRQPSNRLRMSVPNPLDTLTSGLASICRLPGGTTVDPDALATKASPNDEGPILKRLYDVENSRACRFVRERITELDLVVQTVIPAAPNSLVFNDAGDPFALPAGAVVPRLVASTRSGDVVVSGDRDIADFLNQAFSLGDGESSRSTQEEPDLQQKILLSLREVGSYVAGPLRTGRGDRVSNAAKRVRPDLPLILYSYEGNQFCRLVREVLTELDLAYELRSAGKGSLRRDELASKSGGSTQCPYLIDPNTGTSMAESAEIIRYLYKTYALYTPPNELLQWVSDVILPFAKPLFATLAPIQAGSRSDDQEGYERMLQESIAEIESTIRMNDVVVYSYDWSPFSMECKNVLKNLNIEYHDVSLGPEWIPGLIKENGALTRAALLKMTGQSSLPHVFVRGSSLGGLFSGTPGLLKSIEDGSFYQLLKPEASKAVVSSSALREEDLDVFS